MKWKIGAVLGVVAVIALAAAVYFRRSGGSVESAPRVGEVIEAIYGLGTVMSDQVYRVRGGLTLQVRRLSVREGDSVKAGDLLLQLDENQFRSPIAGVVTSISFKEGEIIPPQIPIITVTNLKALFLEVSLEQQSILRVKKGQHAAVSFESLRNEKVQGEVAQVYPRDNQFIVRIDIDKWPSGVLPGMTADVAIEVGKKSDVLLIPVKSVFGGQVTRIRQGRKEKIQVKLGVIDGEWAEVTSDNITRSDFILVRGP
ncbi:MAG: efflux RND transporter periplasmic adaptor subunit [Bdellovibrionota bacterium]